MGKLDLIAFKARPKFPAKLSTFSTLHFGPGLEIPGVAGIDRGMESGSVEVCKLGIIYYHGGIDSYMYIHT